MCGAFETAGTRFFLRMYFTIASSVVVAKDVNVGGLPKMCVVAKDVNVGETFVLRFLKK